MSDERKKIIERILEYEAEMFLRVPVDEEPSCRARMQDMILHRRAQFAGWSDTTCLSYLDDLERAKASGLNLMTLKYARMDKLINPLSENPCIGEILDRFITWQRDFISQYPMIMQGGRDIAGFARYLRAELETYSGKTLELLLADVVKAEQEKGNLSIAVYRELARQSGFSSLDDMEKALSIQNH